MDDIPVNKLKILVVEDDQDTRNIYEETLVDAGYEVVTAVDGVDGLEKAQRGGYALIILDVMMPRMDGLTFLSEIQKRNLSNVNGPIVLFTNLSHDPVIKEALSLGAASFIVKSDLNPDQIVAKVRSFLPQVTPEN